MDAKAKMEAMGDARTRIEILYKIIVGEIDGLVDRIEEMDSRIPVLGESISSQATRLETVLGELQQNLARYGAKIDVINKESIERLRVDAQEEMTKYADKLSEDLIKEVGDVAEDIAATVELLKNASGKSVTSLNNAIIDFGKKIKASNPDWSAKRKDFAWIGAMAGLVGGIVAAVITSVVLIMAKPTSPAAPVTQGQYQRSQ